MKQRTMIKYLSYYLSEQTPLYGNSKGINFNLDKQINCGDSCNTMNLSFPNHSGTHIDLPSHFDKNGKTLSDYPAKFWEFNNVSVFDLSGTAGDSQMITPEMFQNLEDINVDLLLIKTGYGKYRGTDRYTLTPPGLSSKLAGYFRNNFPKIRCIGMDLISITSYSNREEGRKAHHEFLNPKGSEKPILLIEDMNLDITCSIKKVIVAPLLIEKADGVPCTVLAFC